MKVALATLCLNESEFLEESLSQHLDWPDLACWAIIEAADPKYAEANPDLVTKDGLSTDTTGEILRQAARLDSRVRVNRYGWMRDSNVAQSKTVGRDRYLDIFEDIKPDFFLVIDADEFYTRDDQKRINEFIRRTYHDYYSWRFTQRHIWAPPSIQKPPYRPDRFRWEVTGGYWAVRHVRAFRWVPGLRYRTDHNYPLGPRMNPLRRIYDGGGDDPQCIHLGFARRATNREATNRYYRQRGEGPSDGRQKYVNCRAAWEVWKPGRRLPNGAKVISYSGPIPEAYLEEHRANRAES